MTIERIVGPPGCGKTYAVLKRIEKACDKYFPEQIGACSLTNTAVNEMKQRVVDTTNIDANAINNMNTVHGMCFQLLEIGKDAVAEPQMADFIQKYKIWDLTPTAGMTVEGEFAFGSGEDMPIMSRIQIYRQRMIDVDDWDRESQKLWADWSAWMEEEQLIDFTGMLEKVLERELIPNVSILFVDEAQDMSPLQNSITRMWGNAIEHIVFSGDANQAIFRFAGSEAEVFKSLHTVADEETILSQSYRVPQNVIMLSNKILEQASDREDIEYVGRKDVDGKVVMGESHGFVSRPDLSLPGTHMIISRCRYRVKNWTDWLHHREEPFHNPYRPTDRGWNPMANQIVVACRAYRNLGKGVAITGAEFKALVKNTIAKGNLPRGFKTKISTSVKNRELYDVFDVAEMGLATHMIDGTASYNQLFGSANTLSENLAYSVFNSKKLFDVPRVIVGTIHSVKGGEADHVWIDDIIPRTIANSMDDDLTAYNDEVRCAYVAVTRARVSVGILSADRGIHNEIYEVMQ